MNRSSTCSRFLAGIAALSVSTFASADLTPIATPPTKELSHAEIFSNIYGGSFSSVGDGSLSNSSITATRIDDDLDQVYAAGLYAAQVKAVYAAFDQTFGYLAGDDGLTVTPLFKVKGSGFGVVGSSKFETNDQLRFARTGDLGTLASTHERNNEGNNDHVITYKIDGLSLPDTTLMLFFEDKPYYSSDRDFNDLVVQVHSGEAASIIPTPLALPAGLLGLGVMAFRRRRAH